MTLARFGEICAKCVTHELGSRAQGRPGSDITAARTPNWSRSASNLGRLSRNAQATVGTIAGCGTFSCVASFAPCVLASICKRVSRSVLESRRRRRKSLCACQRVYARVHHETIKQNARAREKEPFYFAFSFMFFIHNFLRSLIHTRRVHTSIHAQILRMLDYQFCCVCAFCSVSNKSAFKNLAQPNRCKATSHLFIRP